MKDNQPVRNRILRDKSFLCSIILTLIFFGTGIVFLLEGLAGFTWILFCFLPVILGLSIGALPNKQWALAGAGLATLVLLFGLIAFGFSGLICVIMSLPFIVPLIFLGAVITHLIKRYKEIKTDSLPVLILPLILFLIAAPAEHFLSKDRREVIEITTERVFHFTPEQVYDAIKSVDTLDAEKPLLMKLDLPVPVKCVLEKEEVGGLRTCYFKEGNSSRNEFGSGTITEKISELERGKVLKMDVIACNITGRKWLGFKQAIYYFKPDGKTGCRLIRITTYTSVLAPRFYWEPVEKICIEQEHEYVFNNLKKDLERKYVR